jgi:Family of unknown function (DUF5317)
MILIVMAVVAVLSVPLTGGRLRALADIELRWLWAAPLALALQVLIITVFPDGHQSLHEAVHVATYALAGVFLWANRRLPGAALLGVGTVANAIPIVLNRGIMPQWATAHRLAGLPAGTGFQNSTPLAHPHLLWLGDVIPFPAPWGLHNVLSIGDIAIFAGMAVLLHRTCGSRLPRRRPSLDTAAIATTDEALGAATVAFQAVMALWQAGRRADSELSRRVLAVFEARVAAVAELPIGGPALDSARDALARLSRELGAWATETELSRERERALFASERILATARSGLVLAQLRPGAATAGLDRADSSRRWSPRRIPFGPSSRRSLTNPSASG